MHPSFRFVRTALLAAVLLLASQAYAQATDDRPANTPGPDPKQESNSSFGNVMLKLGKGLVREVSRRLNLEESEVVTVKKEVAPDGREKYRVNTGKFSFTVRKREKNQKADQ
jgi:hypothetical protein